MKTVRSLMILVAGLVPSLAFGSIVQTDSTDGPDQNLFPCSATDLIDASQGLASQVLAGGVVGGDSAALNDGSVGPTNAVTGPWSGVFGSSWTATYTLNTNVNTFGYTITNISTFAGWLSDRVDQSYGLSLAFVSDPQTFVSYGNFSVTFGSAGSSKIELTDPSGQIASGVCAIRFSINGGTFYREFDVSGMPTVQEVPIITSSNVTAVTSSTATFNGYLSNTGAAPTTVLVYWGATDKGTNATWDNVYKLADDTSPGAFSTNVTTGLSDVTCYYRYCATNSYGVSWATSSVSFVAGDVTIAATQPAASELGPVSGTFTVTRPAAATNEALVVYYSVAGSASNGLDYTTLTGSVTIPAASNSASITVDPIFDAIVEPGGENVMITLAGGAYHVGTPDQAIVTIADAPLTSIFAEGGMVTNIDGFIIHTFTNSDTLTVTRGGLVEILVVAGGGGGGSTIGGGGGAGGLIHNYSYMLTKGTHTIVVGAGGAGAAESGANSGLSGTNGADSSLDALIAYGGGGGGGFLAAALSGGSGGGGGSGQSDHTGGTFSPGQGHAGGNGGSGALVYAGGGGGGAGGAGAAGVGGVAAGDGGVGLAYAISGVSKYYAGGGGGGAIFGYGTAGAAGNGGGGAGRVDNVGADADAYTGGGGGSGGWRNDGVYLAGGAGGSGIVIVRYAYVPMSGTIFCIR